MPQTPVVELDYGALLNKSRQVEADLMSGQAVASYTDQNGEQVTYSKTDLGRLATYIAWLEGKCGITSDRVAAPMSVWLA